jgi:hypothetical protein
MWILRRKPGSEASRCAYLWAILLLPSGVILVKEFIQLCELRFKLLVSLVVVFLVLAERK